MAASLAQSATPSCSSTAAFAANAKRTRRFTREPRTVSLACALMTVTVPPHAEAPDPDRLNRWRYGLYAPVYDWIAGFFSGQRKVAISALCLRAGQRVLLVGCGTGLDLPNTRFGPQAGQSGGRTRVFRIESRGRTAGGRTRLARAFGRTGRIPRLLPTHHRHQAGPGLQVARQRACAFSRVLRTLMSISALTTVARALARRTSAFINSRLRVSSSSAVVGMRGLRAEAGASEVPLFMGDGVDGESAGRRSADRRR